MSVLEKAKAKSCSPVIHPKGVLHPNEQKTVNLVNFLSFHFNKSNSGFDCFTIEKSKDTDHNEMTRYVRVGEPTVEICPNSNL